MVVIQKHDRIELKHTCQIVEGANQHTFVIVRVPEPIHLIHTSKALIQS